MERKELIIAGKKFSSRLFIGTGKFADGKIMQEAILASGSEMVTVSLKRTKLVNQQPEDNITKYLFPLAEKIIILPNTSGVRDAEEAVFAAKLAREALGTNWVKLEIHPDPRYLLPDPVETLKATEKLAKLGFVVLPYIHADPVLCKKLEEAGAAAVMPLGAPIGTNKGLKTLEFLQIIIEESLLPVVVDAGIGTPSHAAQAMEIGADAVLINTAIAISRNPIITATAFKKAIEAGRMAYEVGIPTPQKNAIATSPLTSFLSKKS